MSNHNIDLEKLNRKQLLSLLIDLQEELQKHNSGGLKNGQRIIIGSKYAGKKPFYEKNEVEQGVIETHDAYDGIIGEYAYIDGGQLIPIGEDEEGNQSYCISVILERERYKKRKSHCFIHPEDAVAIE